jgi:DNA-binding Lrp family transcriptional regulator
MESSLVARVWRWQMFAYILIQVEVGKSSDVSREVGGLRGIVSADAVTGPYDVIAKADAQSLDELGKLVVAMIQSVPGVTRTLTCPVIRI